MWRYKRKKPKRCPCPCHWQTEDNDKHCAECKHLYAKKKKTIGLDASSRHYRQQLVKRLDYIFSYIIRERDKWTCKRCGGKYQPPTNGLQNSHFWGRRHMGTRWSLENCDALCAGCHMLWEPSKMGAYRTMKIQQLGENGYDVLEYKATSTTKYTIRDLEIMYLEFRELYTNYSGKEWTVDKGKFLMPNYAVYGSISGNKETNGSATLPSQQRHPVDNERQAPRSDHEDKEVRTTRPPSRGRKR